MVVSFLISLITIRHEATYLGFQKFGRNWRARAEVKAGGRVQEKRRSRRADGDIRWLARVLGYDWKHSGSPISLPVVFRGLLLIYAAGSMIKIHSAFWILTVSHAGCTVDTYSGHIIHLLDTTLWMHHTRDRFLSLSWPSFPYEGVRLRRASPIHHHSPASSSSPQSRPK